jgi:hypothetical protein
MTIDSISGASAGLPISGVEVDGGPGAVDTVHGAGSSAPVIDTGGANERVEALQSGQLDVGTYAVGQLDTVLHHLGSLGPADQAEVRSQLLAALDDDPVLRQLLLEVAGNLPEGSLSDLVANGEALAPSVAR